VARETTALRAVPARVEEITLQKGARNDHQAGGNTPCCRTLELHTNPPPVMAAVSPTTAEAAFWERCAEYDDGRITQEADHLFDSSYPWAF
jgi:hypothetical protein